MNLINTINNDDIIKEIKKFSIDNGISDDEVICSIVYEFAKNLPYSIDYKDSKFVPGIFLNMSPVHPKSYIFKYNSSLYNRMLGWGDTIKSGILLQLCFVFQTMLMNKIQNNYHLDEDDYYNLGINNMTSNKEYNLYLFDLLKSLPEYCTRLNSTESTEDRRKILDEVYDIMLQRVGQKVGGFKKTSVSSDVITVQEHKASICWKPHRDLEMLYYFEHIDYGYDCEDLLDNINKKMNVITPLDGDVPRKTLHLHD